MMRCLCKAYLCLVSTPHVTGQACAKCYQSPVSTWPRTKCKDRHIQTLHALYLTLTCIVPSHRPCRDPEALNVSTGGGGGAGGWWCDLCNTMVSENKNTHNRRLHYSTATITYPAPSLHLYRRPSDGKFACYRCSEAMEAAAAIKQHCLSCGGPPKLIEELGTQVDPSKCYTLL